MFRSVLTGSELQRHLEFKADFNSWFRSICIQVQDNTENHPQSPRQDKLRLPCSALDFTTLLKGETSISSLSPDLEFDLHFRSDFEFGLHFGIVHPICLL